MGLFPVKTSPDLGTKCLGHIPTPHTQTHMSPHLQQGWFCQGWLVDANSGTVAAAIPLLCCQLVVAVFVCLLSPGWVGRLHVPAVRLSRAALSLYSVPPLSLLCRCPPEQ